MALKIAIGNTVEYKLLKAEAGKLKTKRGSNVATAKVVDIDENGSLTTVKLTDGSSELVVSYHRSRFAVTKTATRVFFKAKDGEPTKKERALKIVKALGKKGTRADAIAKFKSELSLGPAGASTYYQNIKSGRWS